MLILVCKSRLPFDYSEYCILLLIVNGFKDIANIEVWLKPHLI